MTTYVSMRAYLRDCLDGDPGNFLDEIPTFSPGDSLPVYACAVYGYSSAVLDELDASWDDMPTRDRARWRAADTLYSIPEDLFGCIEVTPEGLVRAGGLVTEYD